MMPSSLLHKPPYGWKSLMSGGRAATLLPGSQGRPAFRCWLYAARQTRAENFPHDGYAEGYGRRRGAGGRLDTQAGYPGGNKVLQQIPVIRGYFDDEAARVETKLADHPLCILGGVSQPGRGGTGEVGRSLALKSSPPAAWSSSLDQPAVAAHPGAKRKSHFLGASKVRRRQRQRALEGGANPSSTKRRARGRCPQCRQFTAGFRNSRRRGRG